MKILALLGAIQGIVLFFYVLPHKKNKKANVNFLIGMSLAIIQMLLVFYVQSPNAPQGNIFLKMITWVLPYFVPAFLFFYFKFLLESKQTFSRADIVYLLPGIVGVIATLPYLFIALNSDDVWDTIDHYNFVQLGFLQAFFHSGVIVVFGKRMYMLHDRYKNQIMNLYSGFELNQLRWIQGNALGVTIIGATGFIAAIFGLIKIAQPSPDLYDFWAPDYLIFIPVSLLFYWYGYKVIQSPELFRFIDEVKPEKYSHSSISSNQASELAEKLIELMNTKKMYLNPQLKLSDVAEELKVSRQILSQVINQHFDQNFFNFINAYRIQVAKENLLNPALSNLTIQGIAIESGFKSKSTFYDLFKKNTGMTPKQFQNKSHN